MEQLLTFPKDSFYKVMVPRRDRCVIGERRHRPKGDVLLWTWLLCRKRLCRWRFHDGRVDLSEHLGGICFLKVGTDAAEERDTILRTEFLVDKLKHATC